VAISFNMNEGKNSAPITVEYSITL